MADLSLFDLTGRTALITGSSQGIGYALAAGMAKAGARIILNGRDVSKLQSAADSLIAQGATVDQLAFDATDHEAARTNIDGYERDNGPIDICVNNAGMQYVAPVEEFPVDKWDTIIALNLSSAFHTARMAVPHMKGQGWGRIICTASAHSLTASPFKAAYVAAKHGLTGLVKTLALELAESGVTANCISPGYVWTPLVENQIPDTMAARNMSREDVIKEVILERQPTKRFSQPEEIGAMALFLCSEAAQNVTGANFSMDGGWTAQ